MANRLWYEVKDEVLVLEERTAQWLLGAADPTRVDWLRLSQCMTTGSEQLLQGEIACDQQLRCMGCDKGFTVRGTITLELCGSCGCGFFQADMPTH